MRIGLLGFQDAGGGNWLAFGCVSGVEMLRLVGLRVGRKLGWMAIECEVMGFSFLHSRESRRWPHLDD